MKLATFLCLLLLLGRFDFSSAQTVDTSSGGLTLSANLETVDNWPGGTTVLITHGTLSHNGSELIETLQTLFKEHGFSSLAINLSLGIDNRRLPFDCKLTHRHTQEDAPVEIAAWQKWLEGRGVTDIVPLGHSRGGNQTTRYLASNNSPSVTRAILLAPALAQTQNLNEHYQKANGKALSGVLARAQAAVSAGKPDTLLTHTDFLYCPDTTVTAASFLSYYQPAPGLDTASLLKRTKLPILVITGTNDTTVPGIAQALAPLARTGRITMVNIDGADHFFRDLYADDLVEQAIEFLNQD